MWTQSRLPEMMPPVTPKHFFAELDQYEMALIASLQADARSFKSALSDFREQHGRVFEECFGLDRT